MGLIKAHQEGEACGRDACRDDWLPKGRAVTTLPPEIREAMQIQYTWNGMRGTEVMHTVPEVWGVIT